MYHLSMEIAKEIVEEFFKYATPEPEVLKYLLIDNAYGKRELMPVNENQRVKMWRDRILNKTFNAEDLENLKTVLPHWIFDSQNHSEWKFGIMFAFDITFICFVANTKGGIEVHKAAVNGYIEELNKRAASEYEFPPTLNLLK